MSIIDHNLLRRADADPARLEAEAKKFDRDPDGYIEVHSERLRKYDFPLFCRLIVKITTKDGRLVPFRFNRVQRRLWRWLIEDLATGKPLRWFIVKARQQGVSTLVLVFFYWVCSQLDHRNGLVLTHDEASVQNFNARVRSLHAEVHPMLQSPTITNNRELLHFGTTTAERKKGVGAGLDSKLLFFPAKTAELGRSYNFQYALLSEFCSWPTVKPPIDIDDKLTSLNSAIAELGGTIIIKEATPKGLNRAAEIFNDPTNGYRKIFIPWAAFDEYRMDLLPGEILDLCGAEESGGAQTRYGDEREESRLIAAALREWYPEEVASGGDEWIESEILARLNWRRYFIDKKCSGDKSKFRQEYPTTAAHGFMATSKNVFDLGSLDLLKKAVADEGIQPERYRYIHDPDELDPAKRFAPDPYGPITVYKPIDPEHTYVIAADPGLGIPNTSDPSALVVLDVTDGLEEVASFNQIISPDLFAGLCYCLGLLFNKALLGVENNERGGYAVNLTLHKSLYYPRLYYRFDAYDSKTAKQPGFVTKSTAKGTLVTDLAQLIRDHEILIRTPHTIEQLEHYMELENEELGGAPGWNDDFVSALWIAVHLASKIHLFPAREEPPGPGTAAYAFRKHAESRNRPGLFR